MNKQNKSQLTKLSEFIQQEKVVSPVTRQKKNCIISQTRELVAYTKQKTQKDEMIRMSLTPFAPLK
jgi:nucleoside diphosphate kinase